MKKIILLSICSTIALFSSCEKNHFEGLVIPDDAKQAYVDASSKQEWHYFSFGQNKIVGSAAESEENNAIWKARKDWDLAIRRFEIRTNSGEFTSTGASGGVHTLDSGITFVSVTKVPKDATFATDKTITSAGMGGTSTVIRSEATVINFKKRTDGSLVMPPVYLPAPIYIFRTADGTAHYKVQFIQYKNEKNATGHVRFIFNEISK